MIVTVILKQSRLDINVSRYVIENLESFSTLKSGLEIKHLKYSKNGKSDLNFGETFYVCFILLAHYPYFVFEQSAPAPYLQLALHNIILR